MQILPRFLCFLRCFIHFNADLNDFCKECTKKTAAQVRVLLGERCVRKNANEVHDLGNLLLSCDFENALRVVNFNFAEALEDTLTEQERSILTFNHRGTDIFKNKACKLNFF